MPFIVPFIPAIIGAAGAVGAAKLKGDATRDAAKLAGAGGGGAGGLGSVPTDIGQIPPQATAAIEASRTNPAAEAAKGYYEKALGGDRETMQSLLGPEIQTVLSQYDTAAKTAAELSPRGGGRTEQMGELPFQKVGEYGRQLATVRPKAAQALGTLGEAEQAREAGLAGSFLGFGESAQRLALERSQQRQGMFMGLGKGIGGFLLSKDKSGKPMYSKIGGIFGSIFGKGKSTDITEQPGDFAEPGDFSLPGED